MKSTYIHIEWLEFVIVSVTKIGDYVQDEEKKKKSKPELCFFASPQTQE